MNAPCSVRQSMEFVRHTVPRETGPVDRAQGLQVELAVGHSLCEYPRSLLDVQRRRRARLRDRSALLGRGELRLHLQLLLMDKLLLDLLLLLLLLLLPLLLLLTELRLMRLLELRRGGLRGRGRRSSLPHLLAPDSLQAHLRALRWRQRTPLPRLLLI